MMNVEQLKPVVEALLMVSESPIPVDRLGKLLAEDSKHPVSRDLVRDTLEALQGDYAERGVELAEVASGWRFRARADYAEQVGRLWEERKPRYSRAFLETLAIIAYRQPITRGEIEHIRGVAVSSNIMRQLLEREWVKVVGHRDVPGRPAVFATTREFLDYFGLKSLEDMPSLAEIRDIDDINADLFGTQDTAPAVDGDETREQPESDADPAPTEAELAPDDGQTDGQADGNDAGQDHDPDNAAAENGSAAETEVGMIDAAAMADTAAADGPAEAQSADATEGVSTEHAHDDATDAASTTRSD